MALVPEFSEFGYDRAYIDALYDDISGGEEVERPSSTKELATVFGNPSKFIVMSDVSDVPESAEPGSNGGYATSGMNSFSIGVQAIQAYIDSPTVVNRVESLGWTWPSSASRYAKICGIEANYINSIRKRGMAEYGSLAAILMPYPMSIDNESFINCRSLKFFEATNLLFVGNNALCNCPLEYLNMKGKVVSFNMKWISGSTSGIKLFSTSASSFSGMTTTETIGMPLLKQLIVPGLKTEDAIATLARIVEVNQASPEGLNYIDFSGIDFGKSENLATIRAVSFCWKHLGPKDGSTLVARGNKIIELMSNFDFPFGAKRIICKDHTYIV